MTKIHLATVLNKFNVAPNIICLKVLKPREFIFCPGQFARLGLNVDHQKTDLLTWRAQSIANNPQDNFLEFLIILEDGGAFSELLKLTASGNGVHLDERSYGFFTLDRFLLQGDLWLLATGTGIAPFLSIISEKKVWHNFQSVNLLHSVRDNSQIIYTEKIFSIFRDPSLKNYVSNFNYVPFTTRCSESTEGILAGKTTTFDLTRSHFIDILESSWIKENLKLDLSIEKSKIMLCGNPNMVKETRKYLQLKGFAISRKDKPGQIAVESFW